jgi:hypothetical protein
MLDEETQTVVCNFGNDYPIYMLIDTTEENSLFANETECIAALGRTGSPSMKPTAVMPPTATNERYYYPQVFGDDTVCFYGSKSKVTALANMTSEEQESYLSSTMCECCSKHGCGLATSSECSVFYPETFDGKNYCLYGPKKDVTALLNMTSFEQNAYLSVTNCECCEKHNCALDMSSECGSPSITTTTAATTLGMTTTMTTATIAPTATAATTAATTTATTVEATTSTAITTGAATIATPTMTTIATPATTTTDVATTTTVAGTTTVATTSSYHFYPTKHKNETWCFYGDITNDVIVSNYPRENADLYTTLCECCLDYICFASLEAECAITNTTATTAATIAATTTTSTGSPTTIDATTPSSSRFFYPRLFEGHPDAWCAYGDLKTDLSMANVNRGNLYLTLCECCANHMCPEYVEYECKKLN